MCAACHVSCRAGQWSAPSDRAVQYHHAADGSFAPPAQLLPLRVPPTLLRITALIFVPSDGPNESSRAPAAVTRAWVLHLARTHGALEGLAGKERNDTAMHGDAEAVRPRLAVRHQPVQQNEVDHGAIRPAQDADFTSELPRTTLATGHGTGATLALTQVHHGEPPKKRLPRGRRGT